MKLNPRRTSTKREFVKKNLLWAHRTQALFVCLFVSSSFGISLPLLFFSALAAQEAPFGWLNPSIFSSFSLSQNEPRVFFVFFQVTPILATTPSCSAAFFWPLHSSARKRADCIRLERARAAEVSLGLHEGHPQRAARRVLLLLQAPGGPQGQPQKSEKSELRGSSRSRRVFFLGCVLFCLFPPPPVGKVLFFWGCVGKAEGSGKVGGFRGGEGGGEKPSGG